MGVNEGKAVGQWFGPNTVAQVLKKLAIYDEWSGVNIHIAMDNTVIINDIKMLGLSMFEAETKGAMSRSAEAVVEGASCMELSNGCYETQEQDRQSFRKASTASDGFVSPWKPVFLVIPLRLGLTEVNPMYLSSLQICLKMRQSVGFVGGKPNHAHWFIGHVGDELVYLDPHTTQLHVDITEQGSSDETFHCPYASRLGAKYIDPSIALGFFFGNEVEFDGWCQAVNKEIMSQKTPMFELHQFRPHHWPPFEPYAPRMPLPLDYTLVEDRQYDTSDEDFELL